MSISMLKHRAGLAGSGRALEALSARIIVPLAGIYFGMAGTVKNELISDPCFPKGPVFSMMRLLRVPPAMV
jgi:hypothetical protein